MDNDSPVAELMDSEAEYNTGLGSAYQGDSKKLLEKLPDNSIDLVVTSPPFALQSKKEYGNKDQEGYNDWFLNFVPKVYDVLQPHGSFVIEIGGAFKKGRPERSDYQFQLLTRILDETRFRFAQDFYWYNPAKLPNPTEWVNVRKIRVTDAVTHIWWLAPEINGDPFDENPRPEASNQRVLQEYSDSQKKLLETGDYNDGKRSSGWHIGEDSFANDNEGAIPDNLIEGPEADNILTALNGISVAELIEDLTGKKAKNTSAREMIRAMDNPDNLIEAANTASRTQYLRLCREKDVDSHPARFPRQIPEFFINYLTPDPPYTDWNRGRLDKPIVLDIFAGSNMTGKVAEKLGRHWLAFEEDGEYVDTSQFRFLNEDQIEKLKNEDESNPGEFATLGDDN